MTFCNHTASVYLWIGKRNNHYIACGNCSRNSAAPRTWEYNVPCRLS